MGSKVKLKTHAITTVFAAMLLLINNLFSYVYAADDTATITITGTVKANTCAIDDNSKNQTVPLPDISDRDIQKSKMAGERSFNIILTGCGAAASAVKVTASGTADENDGMAFANNVSSSEGGATGVGVYVYETDNATQFKPDGSTTETSTLTPSQDNTLTYKVAYVGTQNTATAGKFSSIMNMKFEYQ
ncbi:fimbrial protein [Lonsdalea quercina]|uniref:fimbrial protein n=1 Tax=Lonsdalea quercina TaxID=71657 RepID=UPI0039770128